jgi:hypothetical protein
LSFPGNREKSNRKLIDIELVRELEQSESQRQRLLKSVFFWQQTEQQEMGALKIQMLFHLFKPVCIGFHQDGVVLLARLAMLLDLFLVNVCHPEGLVPE